MNKNPEALQAIEDLDLQTDGFITSTCSLVDVKYHPGSLGVTSGQHVESPNHFGPYCKLYIIFSVLKYIFHIDKYFLA